MQKKLITALQYILFLGLGIFLVWWSIHKMDEKEWERCKEALKSARYILIIPVFLIISASHISRAIRWKILMKPMGYNPSFHNTFFAVMVGYLANLAFPRLGEVLKCTLLARYEKVPADKLVGTILIERAVDVLCLLVVFIITVIAQFDLIGQFAKETIQTNFLKGGWGILIAKAGILLIFIAMFYLGARIIFKRYSNVGFIKKIKAVFEGVKTGLMSVSKMENKWAFIFHSVFIWCCYLGGTYLGFFATLGTEQLPVIATFPVLAFASIGMVLTPGGIGAYPWFVKEVMIRYNIEEGIANANGLLQWMAQCVIILVVGFVCLALLPYFNKKKATA
ncbi:MAG: lysylphosphatidylglycerol synthase transmembrane domain-containing protein [Bacteroidota bacterium]